MARIAQMSARRVDRIGVFALLLAIVPAGAAFGAGSSPNVALSPTPLPKVEVQTVGTGPHFLTAMEEQKLDAAMRQASARSASTVGLDATALAFPWRLSFVNDKGPEISTFVPIPGFAERTILAKPFVARPNTAVEREAGPDR